MNLPELGVGLNWFPGLEHVLQVNAGLIDVIEIEPQMFSRKNPGKTFTLDETSLAGLGQWPYPKVVHGVGTPFGGTVAPTKGDLDLLRAVVDQVDAPWVSEHLNFNRVADGAGTWHTGFLLPPRQTLAGVEVAISSIRSMRARMPVPVAIETGANYLRPRADEVPDGEFVGRVAEGADCGILLDLHNVWTNGRNGRQSIGDYIEQLPLERVWEVHLAGGYSQHGYWLDAHSGAIPSELLELAGRIVPRLPNVKAIIFELLPYSSLRIDESMYRAQLEALHRLWDRRNTLRITERPVRSEPAVPDPAPSPSEWEYTLASVSVRKTCETVLAQELQGDPGLGVIRQMIERLRGSMVVRALRLSSRLIMLERGTGYLEELLVSFWKTHPPQPFALDEAEAFASFLRECKPYVPFLFEVLEYDRAVIAVAQDGEERSIPFGADPLPLLGALGAGRRPTQVATGNFEVRLTPDQLGEDARALAGMQVIH